MLTVRKTRDLCFLMTLAVVLMLGFISRSRSLQFSCGCVDGRRACHASQPGEELAISIQTAPSFAIVLAAPEILNIVAIAPRVAQKVSEPTRVQERVFRRAPKTSPPLFVQMA